MNKTSKTILALVFLVSLFSFVIAEPFGATITENTNTTGTADAAESAAAYAGNITDLDFTGSSVTQTWQGYVGNVSGTIQLEDSSNNILYNWSQASPQGEIYASTNGTGIDWTYTQCLNFTANGTYDGDLDNGGLTSQGGANLTYLEGLYNIGGSDVDGVNETFSLLGTHENGFGLTHDAFVTNSLSFSAGECISTHLFDTNDNVTDSTFQEVLLYEPSSASVIFASILDDNVEGYDGRQHDFQMLVLEDGHSGDTATTSYFFYVELE